MAGGGRPWGSERGLLAFMRAFLEDAVLELLSVFRVEVTEQVVQEVGSRT